MTRLYKMQDVHLQIATEGDACGVRCREVGSLRLSVADWRTVSVRNPASVRIDISDYAAELDSVDAAVRKSLAAHGRAEGLSPFGWGEGVVKDSIVVGVNQRPIAPVVGPVMGSDPARVAVAIHQRMRWSIQCSGSSDKVDAFYVLQAMVDRLLSRRLKLTAETGRALLVLVTRPSGSKPARADFYLTPVLKQVEQSFAPPVPQVIRAVLLCLVDELSVPFSQRPWEGGRGSKPVVPRRHRIYLKRLNALLRVT